MSSNLKSKTYVIPASGLNLETGGQYFLNLAQSEPLNIQLFRSGEQIVDIGGSVSGTKIKRLPFDTISIQTVSGNAGIVTLFVSDLEVDVSALTGTINVNDTTSGIFHAKLMQAFKSSFNAAATAATSSNAQLRNPAASGVNGILTFVKASSDAAISYRMSVLTTAADLGTVSAEKTNAKTSAAAPALVCSYQNTGAPGGLTVFDRGNLSNGADTLIDLREQEIIISPGDAICLGASSIDHLLQGSFHWREEAVGS